MYPSIGPSRPRHVASEARDLRRPRGRGTHRLPHRGPARHGRGPRRSRDRRSQRNHDGSPPTAWRSAGQPCRTAAVGSSPRRWLGEGANTAAARSRGLHPDHVHVECRELRARDHHDAVPWPYVPAGSGLRPAEVRRQLAELELLPDQAAKWRGVRARHRRINGAPSSAPTVVLSVAGAGSTRPTPSRWPAKNWSRTSNGEARC